MALITGGRDDGAFGMTNPRVTLTDVAKRAGVSRTTASFVMTGRRDMRISRDAEQRVLTSARELNYRPSLLARSLRSNLSQTIGLLSDTIASESFAGEVVRGAMTTALLQEHLVFIGETQGDLVVEKRLVESMLDRGVGGFVHASMYTRNIRVSKLLREHPLVLLNSLARGKALPSIVPDDLEAGRAAARELLRHGHRDKVVVVGDQMHNVVAAAERLAGVEGMLHDQGTHLMDSVDALWWPGYAHTAVSEFLAAGSRPTAFICLNDRIAMGTYQAVQDFGLNVPEDISVISFDDSDLATWLRPQLTSIGIPHFEMGRRAVETLLNPENRPIVHRIPMPLRVRDSVGPPPTHRRGRTSKRSGHDSTTGTSGAV